MQRCWSDLGTSRQRCEISNIVELKLNDMLVLSRCKDIGQIWAEAGTGVGVKIHYRVLVLTDADS